MLNALSADPAATVRTPERPTTSTGVLLSAKVPLPSWPWVLAPWRPVRDLHRSKPCFVYVLVKERATNNRDAVKVGVAGCEPVYDRIADFARKGWHLSWSMGFDIGHEAEAVERSVLALLWEETGQTPRQGPIPHEDMPNAEQIAFAL